MKLNETYSALKKCHLSTFSERKNVIFSHFMNEKVAKVKYKT